MGKTRLGSSMWKHIQKLEMEASLVGVIRDCQNKAMALVGEYEDPACGNLG